MKRKIVSFLFLLFCATKMLAQGFVFENLGESISKKDSLKIIRMIQYEVDFYNKIQTLDSVHVKLWITDKKSVFNLKKTIHLTEAAGVYKSETQTSYVRRKGNKDYLSVVYHENSHYLLHLLLGKNPPAWLNEGLARYFQRTKTSKKKIEHYMGDYEKARIKTMIEIKDVDLKNIVATNKKDFMKAQRTNENYAYTLSHGIVYFLIEKDFERFKQIVLKIKKGDSSFNAISAVYPNGFNQFETDFISYFSR